MALVKTQNAEGGSDARYDVSKMTPEERTQFDGEGRPLGSSFAPDQWTWTDGIIGARGGWGPGGPPGGGGGGGGAGGGAFYEQLKSMLQAQGAGDLANTQAAIRKALIGFGLDPTAISGTGLKFEDKLGAVDDVTKSLIAKNTESGISYYARLMEQKKDNLRALIANLSKTGMRRSGAKGAKLRKGQLDFDRLFQDSLSELLGQVGNAYQGYAGNEQNRQMQLLQALQSGGGGGGNVYTGAGSTTEKVNPYIFSGAQRGTTAGGGTQTSVAKFARSLFGGGSGGAITQPTYNTGSGAFKPQ